MAQLEHPKQADKLELALLTDDYWMWVDNWMDPLPAQHEHLRQLDVLWDGFVSGLVWPADDYWMRVGSWRSLLFPYCCYLRVEES